MAIDSAGPIGQDLDAAFALRQLLQQMKAMRVRQRFCDGRKLFEQRQLWIAD